MYRVKLLREMSPRERVSMARAAGRTDVDLSNHQLTQFEFTAEDRQLEALPPLPPSASGRSRKRVAYGHTDGEGRLLGRESALSVGDIVRVHNPSRINEEFRDHQGRIETIVCTMGVYFEYEVEFSGDAGFAASLDRHVAQRGLHRHIPFGLSEIEPCLVAEHYRLATASEMQGPATGGPGDSQASREAQGAARQTQGAAGGAGRGSD